MDQKSIVLMITILSAFFITPTVSASEQASLTLALKGFVEPSCRISGSSASNISLAWDETKLIEFVVNCNTPFNYSLTSKFGGLKYLNNSGASVAGSSYSTIANYSISVDIPLEQGNKSKILDHCTSQSIQIEQVDCQFANSGTSIAINKTAKIYIKPDQSEYHNLLAGTYEDTLVIEFTIN